MNIAPTSSNGRLKQHEPQSTTRSIAHATSQLFSSKKWPVCLSTTTFSFETIAHEHKIICVQNIDLPKVAHAQTLFNSVELMVPFHVASQDIQGIRSVFHWGTSEGSRSLNVICKHRSRGNQTQYYINFSLLFKEFNFVCLLQYESHSLFGFLS